MGLSVSGLALIVGLLCGTQPEGEWVLGWRWDCEVCTPGAFLTTFYRILLRCVTTMSLVCRSFPGEHAGAGEQPDLAELL